MSGRNVRRRLIVQKPCQNPKHQFAGNFASESMNPYPYLTPNLIKIICNGSAEYFIYPAKIPQKKIQILSRNQQNFDKNPRIRRFFVEKSKY